MHWDTVRQRTTVPIHWLFYLLSPHTHSFAWSRISPPSLPLYIIAPNGLPMSESDVNKQLVQRLIWLFVTVFIAWPLAWFGAYANPHGLAGWMDDTRSSSW